VEDNKLPDSACSSEKHEKDPVEIQDAINEDEEFKRIEAEQKSRQRKSLIDPGY